MPPPLSKKLPHSTCAQKRLSRSSHWNQGRFLGRILPLFSLSPRPTSVYKEDMANLWLPIHVVNLALFRYVTPKLMDHLGEINPLHFTGPLRLHHHRPESLARSFPNDRCLLRSDKKEPTSYQHRAKLSGRFWVAWKEESLLHKQGCI